MNFRYFLAPEHLMENLQDSVCWCSLCGLEKQCFLLNFNNADLFVASSEIDINDLDLTKKSDPSLRRYGCCDCLRAGRFLFCHEIDIGRVDSNGFTPDEGQEIKLVAGAVDELLRTPLFYTWQGSWWLTHCNDFMAYLGEWGQEGFNTFAIDGDGQNLFEQTEQLTPGEQWAELRGDGFYIFKCLHCDKMRSFSDCD